MRKYNVTICGFGAIGHSIAVQIGKSSDFNINILTKNKKEKIEKIQGFFKGDIIETKINGIYTNPLDIIPKSDIILITVPGFIRLKILEEIMPSVKKGSIIGFIPGNGGIEWSVKKLRIKDITIFGMERVPYISRLKEYGKVEITGTRDVLKVGFINKNLDEQVLKSILSTMFNKKIEILKTYILIALTTSNAILHTCRLYTIFYKKENKLFEKEPLFYREWDNNTSKLFKACDDEIVRIYNKLRDIGFAENIKNLTGLMDYYESETEEELTEKIRSIEAFKPIKTQMIKCEDGYKIDLNSRYIIEDIPYGLLIFKGIAELLMINTPNIDKIIYWVQELLGKKYIVDGKLYDIVDTGCPQNFGINNLNDFIKIM